MKTQKPAQLTLPTMHFDVTVVWQVVFVSKVCIAWD